MQKFWKRLGVLVVLMLSLFGATVSYAESFSRDLVRITQNYLPLITAFAQDARVKRGWLIDEDGADVVTDILWRHRIMYWGPLGQELDSYFFARDAENVVLLLGKGVENTRDALRPQIVALLKGHTNFRTVLKEVYETFAQYATYEQYATCEGRALELVATQRLQGGPERSPGYVQARNLLWVCQSALALIPENKDMVLVQRIKQVLGDLLADAQ